MTFQSECRAAKHKARLCHWQWAVLKCLIQFHQHQRFKHNQFSWIYQIKRWVYLRGEALIIERLLPAGSRGRKVDFSWWSCASLANQLADLALLLCQSLFQGLSLHIKCLQLVKDALELLQLLNTRPGTSNSGWVQASCHSQVCIGRLYKDQGTHFFKLYYQNQQTSYSVDYDQGWLNAWTRIPKPCRWWFSEISMAGS